MIAYIIGIILIPLRALSRLTTVTPPIVRVVIADKTLMTADAILTEVEDQLLHHSHAAGIEVIVRGMSYDRIKELGEAMKGHSHLAPSALFVGSFSYSRDGHLLFAPVRHDD
jgi:hypothetical protein